MSTSIYFLVRQKLLRHGAQKSRDGRTVFEDRLVFLSFVRLERAIRSIDFEAVQLTVKCLEKYLSEIGKRQVIVFAYMYIYFTDGTPSVGKTLQKEDGSVLIPLTYRRLVTKDERLIAEWGRHMFDWLGNDLLRLVYLSNHDRPHNNESPSRPLNQIGRTTNE